MSLSDETLRSKLEEVAEYYITAKKHLLFSENYSNKTLIGVINELRYSYDHLIKGIVNSNEPEFNKAINHLKRAAYDSCELISLEVTNQIHVKIAKYRTDIITMVLPDYFSNIYPRLVEIQAELSIERGKNDDLFSDSQHLNKYLSLYSELIEFDITITKAIVGMEELKRQRGNEKQKENRRNVIINLIIGILSSIITAIIIYYTPLNSQNSNQQNPQNNNFSIQSNK